MKINSNYTKLNNLVTIPKNSPLVQCNDITHILKGDSGATNHYLSPTMLPTLQNICSNKHVSVTLPDNTLIKSTHTGQLSIPPLRSTATKAHVLPDPQHTSLLSLG